MRPTILCLSFCLSLPAATFAESPSYGAILDYGFKCPATWQLGLHPLVFEYIRGKETVIRDQNTPVFTLNYPNVVTGAIASENGKVLLVLVSQVQSSGGWNYDHLMTVQEISGGTLQFREWLPAGQEPMRKHRWIMELGAISDDGHTILVKMGEPDRDKVPYTVGDVWETWDLSTSKLVKTGLKLCNP